MRFFETVEQIRDLLERHGRVSLGALQREFDLDAKSLEPLIDELVEVQRDPLLERTGRTRPQRRAAPPALRRRAGLMELVARVLPVAEQV